MEDSDSDQEYVTLLKEDLLTAEEVNAYNGNYTSINGEYPYLESNNCNSSNQSACTTLYSSSDIKKIIDNWASKYNNDLINIDNYKARMITENELLDKLDFESDHGSPTEHYSAGEDTPEWSYIDGKPYWSMSQYGDSSSVYGIGNPVTQEKVYNKLYIRPVIYLNKCALPGGCWEE